ncbi:septum formation family protein [Cryobacterium sp. PAMC25264]|uniref:septum formation family protein n=1 Tax=Cryobacterium sp. PAMC25264 TaxID=2861288 RepID=UPI001C62AB8B|nr:septum formation family protein [Cryobacterium sp. PAMC25264]QYF72127.1 septum formation family protein [Cryobacterium sp. PAMC25264]
MTAARMNIRRIGVTLLVLGALTGLSGCDALDGLVPGAENLDEGTTELIPDVSTDVFTLARGDCLDGLDGDLHSGVATVPCSAGHDWEVYAATELDGTEFPGSDVIVAEAEKRCGAAFGPFVGLPEPGAASSELGYIYVTPTEADWTESSHRAIVCLIGDMGGPVAGTLAGAAR